MKTSFIALITGAAASAALMLFAAPAVAGNVDFGINIGVPGFYAPPPAPVYVRPEPVYVEPRPVYIQPRPVYVQPRPYYVQPAPVYVEQDDEYRRYWRARQYRHRHHHDDDDD